MRLSIFSLSFTVKKSVGFFSKYFILYFCFYSFILHAGSNSDSSVAIKNPASITKEYIDVLFPYIFLHDTQSKVIIENFEKFKSKHQDEYIEASFNMMYAFYNAEFHSKYGQGFPLLIKAKETFIRLHKWEELLLTYRSLILFILWNQISKSDFNFQGDLLYDYVLPYEECILKIDDKSLFIDALMVLGSYYTVSGNMSKAQEYFNKAESLDPSGIKKEFLVALNANFTIFYAALKDGKRMNIYKDKCEKDPLFANYHYGRGNVYRSISRFYLESERDFSFDKALYYGKKAADIAERMNTPEYLSLSYKRIYHAYKRLKQFDSAFHYLEKYQIQEDSISRKEFADAISQNSIIKRDLEITRLQQSILNDLNKSKSKLNSVLTISSCVLSLILIFTFYQYRMIKSKNLELIDKQSQIGTAFNNGVETEQKRIASELHDNINTKVAAMVWQIEAINVDKLTERNQIIINKLLYISKDLYKDIRLIAHNIIPADLELRGLDSALQELVINLNNTNKIMFHYFSEYKGELIKHQEFEVFKIILELTNNIIKHSGAEKSWISLTKTNDWINLTIADNGMGHVNEQHFSGIGIRNMHSRVEALHGQIKIISMNDPGYKTLIKIPIIKNSNMN